MPIATTTEGIDFLATQCREVAATAEFFNQAFDARIASMKTTKEEMVALNANSAELFVTDQLIDAMEKCARILRSYTEEMHTHGDRFLGPRE